MLQGILQTACKLEAKSDLSFTVLTVHCFKVGSMFIGKPFSFLKFQIMLTTNWKKIHIYSSLSEEEKSLLHDTFLFLLISFCLHSERCICPHAGLTLQPFLYMQCLADRARWLSEQGCRAAGRHLLSSLQDLVKLLWIHLISVKADNKNLSFCLKHFHAQGSFWIYKGTSC